MDSETAETFFYNVRWFNNFFNDMKSLFDKLGDEIEKMQIAQIDGFIIINQVNSRRYHPHIF